MPYFSGRWSVLRSHAIWKVFLKSITRIRLSSCSSVVAKLHKSISQLFCWKLCNCFSSKIRSIRSRFQSSAFIFYSEKKRQNEEKKNSESVMIFSRRIVEHFTSFWLKAVRSRSINKLSDGKLNEKANVWQCSDLHLQSSGGNVDRSILLELDFKRRCRLNFYFYEGFYVSIHSNKMGWIRTPLVRTNA